MPEREQRSESSEEERSPCPPSGLETFEDLLSAVGTTGRRNVFLFCVCIWCAFISPFPTVSYQLLGVTPDYWCHVDELVSANWTSEQIKSISRPQINDSANSGCQMYDLNYTLAVHLGYENSLNNLEKLFVSKTWSTQDCPRREFEEDSPVTVVTEWDLVCDRRYLYSTTQTMVQIGKLVGALVCGYIMDAKGRRKVILAAIFLYFVFGIVLATVPYLGLYLVLRVVVSALAQGIYVGGFVLSMEISTTSQRSYIGSFFAVPFALGYMAVPGIAYLIRPWYWLQVALTLPILMFIPYFWILPESPRWLIINSKYDEAIHYLTKIAESNDRTLPCSEKISHVMENMNQEVYHVLKSLNKIEEIVTGCRRHF